MRENKGLLIEWLCVEMTVMKNVWNFSYFHLPSHTFFHFKAIAEQVLSDLLLGRSRKIFSPGYINNSCCYFYFVTFFIVLAYFLFSVESHGETLRAEVVIPALICWRLNAPVCSGSGWDGVHFLHSSPCGVFQLCDWNCVDNTPVFWLLLSTSTASSLFLVLPSSLSM